MIDFALPLIWLLLPLPWLICRWMPAAVTTEAALRVPFSQLLDQTSSSEVGVSARGWLHYLPTALIWMLLICAAAQPRWVGEPLALPAVGRDLMLAVDISESMEMQDMQWQGNLVDRLTATRAVVHDFIERRTGDRLGLILFGSESYVHVPLTFDRKTLGKLLDEARIGFAGQATAIGDAIGLAVKRLRDRPDQARVLILMTDGANTAGQIEPIQAAQLASEIGVRIYTVGIGAEELQISGPLGLFNRTVNPSAQLDEKTLRKIAELTGGKYFRARNGREMAEIYRALDELEPVDQNPETYRPVKSLAHWPLGIGFLFSMILAVRRLWPAVFSPTHSIQEPAHHE